MKPLLVAITDTHLDEDNFDQVYSVFEQAIKVVKENNLNDLFHLGDHFTSRASQKLHTLLSFKKIIKLLEKEKITLHTIPGNHDKTNQAVEESYLDVYNSIYLQVFGDKLIIDLPAQKVSLCVLPYFTEEVYNEKLEELKKQVLNSKNKTVLLTHFGINGVLNNDGNKINSIVEVGKFKAFDLTLIGHFHNYNKVTSKVVYIGGTYPRNFGEDSNKGCVILYPDLSMERVKFEFTEYEKIQITNFETPEVEKLLKQYKSETETKKIRFEFVGTEEDFLKIDKKKINSLGIDVTTVNITKIKEVDEVIDTKMSLNLTKKDLIDKFQKYSEVSKVPESKSKKILKYIE